MPVRIVEGQLPYTGGTGIEIDANKVISLLLREENNLILVNDDNEIYTDLQLASNIRPTDDFPVGVTTGKILQSDGWTRSGLLLNRKTTSGDYARWIYANDGKIYFDNGTGTWKQVYYSSEIDGMIQDLNNYIDLNFQPKLTAGAGITIDQNNVISAQGAGTGDVSGPNSSTDGDVAVFDGTTGKAIKDGSVSLSTLSAGASAGATAVQPGDNITQLTNNAGYTTNTGDVVGPASSTDGHIAVFDGATGKLIKDGGAIPTGDVGVSTDTGTLLSAGVDLWLGTETDFSSISTPDTNTLYIQYKSDGGGGWQPGVNTVAYYPLTSVTTNTDQSGNSNTLTNQGATFGTYGGVDCANTAGYSLYGPITNLPTGNSVRTLSVWANSNSGGSYMSIFGYGQNSTGKRCVLYKQDNNTILMSHYTGDVATNITMNNNEWYLCTYTYDGTTAKMYVNGVLTGSVTTTINTTSSDFVISGWGAGNETFNGYISELIIEDKAWSSQDVSDYYDLTKGNYGIS